MHTEIDWNDVIDVKLAFRSPVLYWTLWKPTAQGLTLKQNWFGWRETSMASTAAHTLSLRSDLTVVGCFIFSLERKLSLSHLAALWATGSDERGRDTENARIREREGESEN